VAELLGASSPIHRMANMSDPFGHGLSLIQLVDRGYGEVVTR
jgi:hypothetical protein